MTLLSHIHPVFFLSILLHTVQLANITLCLAFHLRFHLSAHQVLWTLVLHSEHVFSIEKQTPLLPLRRFRPFPQQMPQDTYRQPSLTSKTGLWYLE
jgi:hypothetical protein